MNSRLLLTLAAAAAMVLPAGAQTRSSRYRAVRSCENHVRQQAMAQFGTDDIAFRSVNTSQYGGLRGRVSGMVRIGEEGNSQFRHFSCSVNFGTGYVTSARLAPGRGAIGEAGRDVTALSMDNCQAAITDHIRDQGYSSVQFNSINLDPDGDHVRGMARAQGPYHPESFQFSCSVDPDSGRLLGTNLVRR